LRLSNGTVRVTTHEHSGVVTHDVVYDDRMSHVLEGLQGAEAEASLAADLDR
jgi:hypothetical protein